jgi:hypothetical protein
MDGRCAARVLIGEKASFFFSLFIGGVQGRPVVS